MFRLHLFLVFLSPLLFTIALGQHDSFLSTSTAITVDKTGHIYITGWTEGSLEQKNKGESDVFLAKYDAQGNQIWIRQLGTPDKDTASDIAVDEQGGIYIIGTTEGQWFREPLYTSEIFVVKLDSEGNQLWGKQLGIYDQNEGRGIAVSLFGVVLITGTSKWINPDEEEYAPSKLSASYRYVENNEGFLASLDSDGKFLWQRYLNDGDYKNIFDIATDDLGDIYVTGSVRETPIISNPTGTDAFVAKYASDGQFLWNKQFGGVMHDVAYGIALNGRWGVTVTGYTDNAIGFTNDNSNDHFGDAFIVVYTRHGEKINEILRFGAGRGYRGNDIVIDSTGAKVVVGSGSGNLGGEPIGLGDAFIYKQPTYDHEITFAQRLGTKEGDVANAVAIDATDMIYVTGHMETGFDDRGYFAKAGRYVFIAKYSAVGEQLWLKTFESTP